MAKKPVAKTTAKEAPRPSLKTVDLGQAADAKGHVKEVGAVAKTMYMVPIEHLHVAPGFNVRVTDTLEYKAGIQDLKESILDDGFYISKPLSAYVGRLPDGKDAIFVTDGHRRFEAALLARAEGSEDVAKLPVVLKPVATTAKELTVSLIRENAQQNLTMMEKAIAAKRLLDDKTPRAEVARILKCTERYLDDLAMLIQAPKAVRALVSADKIPGTQAVALLRQDKVKGTNVAEAKLSALADKKSKPKGSGDGGDAGPKMKTVITRYALDAGQTAPYVEIEPFKSLFPDADWYRLTDREGVIEATEPFEVLIKVRRPKRDDAVEEVDEEAPKKRGRRATEPVGVEVDPMTMAGVERIDGESDEAEEDGDALDDEGDGADAPNLRELGIADAAETDDI